MLAAFTLVQAAVVRASIVAWLVDQRFWVLSPSVSRMITLSRSGLGSKASVHGRFDVNRPEEKPVMGGVSLWKAGLGVQRDRWSADIVREHVERISGAYRISVV